MVLIASDRPCHQTRELFRGRSQNRSRHNSGSGVDLLYKRLLVGFPLGDLPTKAKVTKTIKDKIFDGTRSNQDSVAERMQLVDGELKALTTVASPYAAQR